MHEQNKLKKETEIIKKNKASKIPGAKEYNDCTEEFNRELQQLT